MISTENQHLFKWKHYQPDIILLTVRWYLRYDLSFRDLVEMMEERDLSIAHTTIMRWVHQYGPELDERVRPPFKHYFNVQQRIFRAKNFCFNCTLHEIKDDERYALSTILTKY